MRNVDENVDVEVEQQPQLEVANDGLETMNNGSVSPDLATYDQISRNEGFKANNTDAVHNIIEVDEMNAEECMGDITPGAEELTIDHRKSGANERKTVGGTEIEKSESFGDETQM